MDTTTHMAPTAYLKDAMVALDMVDAVLTDERMTDSAKLKAIGALAVFNATGIDMSSSCDRAGRSIFSAFRYRLHKSRVNSKNKRGKHSEQLSDGNETVSVQILDGNQTVFHSEIDNGFLSLPAETQNSPANETPTGQGQGQGKGIYRQASARHGETGRQDIAASLPAWMCQRYAGEGFRDIGGGTHPTYRDAVAASFKIKGYADPDGYLAKVATICGADGDEPVDEIIAITLDAVEKCNRADPWAITRKMLIEDWRTH